MRSICDIELEFYLLLSYNENQTNLSGLKRLPVLSHSTCALADLEENCHDHPIAWSILFKRYLNLLENDSLQGVNGLYFLFKDVPECDEMIFYFINNWQPCVSDEIFIVFIKTLASKRELQSLSSRLWKSRLETLKFSPDLKEETLSILSALNELEFLIEIFVDRIFRVFYIWEATQIDFLFRAILEESIGKSRLLDILEAVECFTDKFLHSFLVENSLFERAFLIFDEKIVQVYEFLLKKLGLEVNYPAKYQTIVATIDYNWLLKCSIEKNLRFSVKPIKLQKFLSLLLVGLNSSRTELSDCILSDMKKNSKYFEKLVKKSLLRSYLNPIFEFITQNSQLSNQIIENVGKSLFALVEIELLRRVKKLQKKSYSSSVKKFLFSAIEYFEKTDQDDFGIPIALVNQYASSCWRVLRFSFEHSVKEILLLSEFVLHKGQLNDLPTKDFEIFFEFFEFLTVERCQIFLNQLKK